MKAFFPTAALALLGLASSHAWGGAEPVVSGPWTEIRMAPVFGAQTQKLSKNWGPTIPIGRPFRVEKVYGRWLFGSPEPPALMLEKDFAKPGWVFSRMLLAPGDEDTLPPALQKQSFSVLYHSQEVWKKIAPANPATAATLDFFESLTLSKGTMQAFRRQDEAPMARLPSFSFLPLAQAEDAPPLGLSGTDLSFLEQEFKAVQAQKKVQVKKKLERKLPPPAAPPLDDKIRKAILGRFMLEKYLDFPSLTQEEVDGFIYMRATAMRALEGCPKNIRDYWKNRRWNMFRVFRLKSRPEIPHPLLETALPGGYFAFSAKSLDLAGNEAELAFLLVRPMVREPRIQQKKITFHPKLWPQELPPMSEEVWDQNLKAQSTKDSENLDVADEIAVDIAATECISRAGYRPMGGLSYLRKLSTKREEPWAKPLLDHLIGLDYRLERLTTLLEESLAQRKFPEGKTSNPKRFSTASRYWNLLP